MVGADGSTELWRHPKQMYLFGGIQTSKTGGQPCSDTSPYKASEYSLEKVKNGVGAMCTYCMLRILREINLILKTIAKLFFSTTTQ